MKLYEFESKRILQNYGLSVPRGLLARTPGEAESYAASLGKPVFLKAQVTVSGRGKAGGILEARDSAEAKKLAAQLFGCRINGLPVRQLLVEERLDILEQLYLSVAVDRQAKSLVALASLSGGMDIEESALNSPQKIVRLPIDPLKGFDQGQAERSLAQIGFEKETALRCASILALLFRAAIEQDAELAEINPLVKTAQGALVAADARIIIDDNALFRHAEWTERNLVRDEDTFKEAQARQRKLTYVDLDGDIGIIGNGAGLLMATQDMVCLFGGRPGSFLDIGGGAQVEVIKNGVLFVMDKPEVRAVLMNILGGITRCDLVAQGIAEGLKAAPLKKPVVVRMMGTNEKEGREILRQNGIQFYDDMERAVEAVIEAGRQ